MTHLVAQRVGNELHLLKRDAGMGDHLAAANDPCDCCEGSQAPTCNNCIETCLPNQFQVTFGSSAGTLPACSEIDGTYILNKVSFNQYEYDWPGGVATCNATVDFEQIDLRMICASLPQAATQEVQWQLKVFVVGRGSAILQWNGRAFYNKLGELHPAPECCEQPVMNHVFPIRPASFPFDDDGLFAGMNCCEWPNVSLDGLLGL